MSGATKKLTDSLRFIADPLGVTPINADDPSGPKIKQPPKIDELEANRRADLVRRVRRQRAIAAQGFSDTRKTGPRGLGPSAGVPSNKRALLGA